MSILSDRRISQLEQERDTLVRSAFAFEAQGKKRAAHRRLMAAAAVDAKLSYLREKLTDLAISQAVTRLRILPEEGS